MCYRVPPHATKLFHASEPFALAFVSASSLIICSSGPYFGVVVFVLLFSCFSAQRTQDHLLPYMTDSRHAPDTLFFVCEEDWRLYPTAERVDAAAVAKEVYTAIAQPLAPFPEQPSAAAVPSVSLRKAFPPTSGEPFAPDEDDGPEAVPHDAGVDPQSAGWERSAGAFYTRQAKPTRRADVESLAPSQEVQDLVKICTLASRRDCGDLIWMSWNGKNERGMRAKPCYGAQMIAVTVTGARNLLDAINRGELPKKHWDVVLRDWLNDPDRASSIGASYVYPAIGNFKEHHSGITDKVRTNLWDEKWCQPGTRQSDWPEGEQRYLCRWLERGAGVDWSTKIVLPEKSEGLLSWKTLRPEEDEDARWEHEWRRWHQGAKPLLTPMAAPNETAFEQGAAPFEPPQTKRGKRQLRANKVNYSHRIFVDDGDQAANKKTTVHLRAVSLSPRVMLCFVLSFHGEPFAPCLCSHTWNVTCPHIAHVQHYGLLLTLSFVCISDAGGRCRATPSADW